MKKFKDLFIHRKKLLGKDAVHVFFLKNDSYYISKWR